MSINKKHVVGKHVILELSGCRIVNDPDAIKDVLIKAAKVSNARILDYRMHTFSDPQGYTGVMLLAESHITFHTWGEYAYIAIDIFMCGQADIDRALHVIRNDIEYDAIESINVDRGYKT